MPLTVPSLDNRRYPELRDEALARISVYTPEWTNYQRSDPGVTIIEVMAFMVEDLLYRANQMPDRMRRKFLTLLDIPLQEAVSARGLVTIDNERGPLETFTLNAGIEVSAGQIPFRTAQGLDVLPVTAQLYYKSRLPVQPEQVKAYYKQLYLAARNQSAPMDLTLYETMQYLTRASSVIDLAQDTVDNSLWIALLTRNPRDDIETAREALDGKTINLGIVPSISEDQLQLILGAQAVQRSLTLDYYIPDVPADGKLPTVAGIHQPKYRLLDASATVNPLLEPGIVQITLPGKDKLKLWDNIEPLDAGTGDFPPSLDNTDLQARVITWLRLSAPKGTQARLHWVGINATEVSQRAHIFNEVLPNGSGEPDQLVRLSKAPVIHDSVQLTVQVGNKPPETDWHLIDDLTAAGPEVPTPDRRYPPGVSTSTNPDVNVFSLDAEAGEIRFGDGARGRRPPFGAVLRADYDYSAGSAGNVGAGTITTSAALPGGLKVTNPVRTWGGAEAETIRQGEKQIARYLQHRDRLVSAADFQLITWRAPGVQIGRVDVLPAYSPESDSSAPGAVTLMIIPRYDAEHPDAPRPNRTFLDAICRYLEPRRLVTTEVYLRGPVYRDIYVAVAIKVNPGVSVAPVREAVKQSLLQYLSPLPPPDVEPGPPETLTSLSEAAVQSDMQSGWPLNKPVVDLELLAVASRVPNLMLVSTVLVAEGNATPASPINLTGLELPHVAGIMVVIGDAQAAQEALRQLRGQQIFTGNTASVPIPIIPEECA